MTKEEKQPDNLFRSKLEGFEQNPPAWVWDSIQEQLAARRRRKAFVWLRYGGVAAALVLAFLIGYDWHQEVLPARHASNQAVAQSEKMDEKGSVPELIQTDTRHLENQKEARTANPKAGSDTGVTGEIFIASDEQFFSEKIDSEAIKQLGFEEEASLSAMTYRPRLSPQLNGGNIKTEELLAMNQQHTGSHLSDYDRLIIAQNVEQMRRTEPDIIPKSWTVGATVAPSVSVRSSGYSDSYSQSMTRATEKSKLSMGGGLTLAMQTRSRWSVQTGVLYSRLGQSSTNEPARSLALDAPSEGGGTNYFLAGKTVGDEVLISGPAGQIVMNALPGDALVLSAFEEAGTSASVLMTSTGFEQVFDYIEIPMVIRYRLIDSKFDLQLMGGLNTGFLIGNAAYQTAGGSRSRIGSTSDMRSVIYSPNLGLGLGYELSPKLQLRVEPQWRYSVESLSRNRNVNYRPHIFGLYTGLSYSF